MTAPVCPLDVRRERRLEACGSELGGTRYVCDYHTRRVRLALIEAPMLYVQLRCALVPSQGTGERVTVSKAPPLPISVGARALQEDIARVVRVAERDYRARRSWSATPPRGREGRALSLACAWLGRHLDDIAETPIVVELAQLLEATSAARRLLGLDRLVHKLPAPCPTCDALALERADGADRVRCRYCGREFTEDDYQRLVLILASDYREAE